MNKEIPLFIKNNAIFQQKKYEWVHYEPLELVIKVASLVWTIALCSMKSWLKYLSEYWYIGSIQPNLQPHNILAEVKFLQIPLDV